MKIRRSLLAVTILTMFATVSSGKGAQAATVAHISCSGGTSGGIYNYVNPGGLREAWTFNFSDCQHVAVLAYNGTGAPTNSADIAYQATYGSPIYSAHAFANGGSVTVEFELLSVYTIIGS